MRYSKQQMKRVKNVTFKQGGSFDGNGMYVLQCASSFSMPDFGEMCASRSAEIQRVKEALRGRK